MSAPHPQATTTLKLFHKTLVAAATTLAALAASTPALADITIGITLPLAGPASGLGIPMQNSFTLWPTRVAGEKLNLSILDDAAAAAAPTRGVQSRPSASSATPTPTASRG